MRSPRHRSSQLSRRVYAAVAALATTVGGLAGLVSSAAPALAANPHPVVSGWMPYWSLDGANADVAGNYNLFTDGSIFGFQAQSATSVIIKPSASQSAITGAIAGLKSRRVKAILTVTDAMGGTTATGAMLADPNLRAQHVTALMNLVHAYGADGLDLDYEEFGPTAAASAQIRSGYPALLAALAARLHAEGKTLAVSLISKTGEPGLTDTQRAYDYVAIGRVVDQAKIMTYDQHWSGGAPGAIASISWTDAIIAFAAASMPPSKVFMGIPLYGYNWTTPGTRAGGVTFQAAQALMAQYNAPRIWSASEAAPSFTYTDANGVAHTVWYNDAQAVQAKLPLVGKYGLGGVAFWSLGGEDPGLWGLMQAFTFGSNPFGNTDSAQPAPGGVRVSGWSIDPNSSNAITVAIYADGHLMANVAANVLRPDVANQYGFFGDSHGFAAVIPLPPGAHQLCAYGLNTGPGTANTALGCKTATALSGNPFGVFEGVAAVPGGFLYQGWDIDPDTAAPVATHIYVDGHLAAVTTANAARSDVAAAKPAYGALHGFSGRVATTAGTHTVCAYALNVGFGNSNPGLGCHSVTVLAGNPFGHLDAAVVGVGVVAGSSSPWHAAVWGWAIDPDTSASIPADLYIDGKFSQRLPATAGRADVAAVYRAYGAAHGFQAIVPLTGGTHSVCVFALNTASGNANPNIGCKTVTVPGGNPISVGSASALSGGIDVAGWALDQDTLAPIQVHVYLDGKLQQILTASNFWAGVGKAYPGFGDNRGYHAFLKPASGTHTVCAYAINVGLGTTNPLIGGTCQRVAVP
ncbi:MAG: hypothetical protein QOJ62_1585 [Actinomycetota bacterium]|nr:hypothetical protein [Actinomycetota bacterium]